MFIIILWVFEEYLIELCNTVLKDLDFWMIELIIISLMISKMFNKRIFKHQKLVYYINIIPCALKMTAIYLSFVDADNTDIIYVKHPLFLFGIIFYFLFITLRSFVNSKIKWHMDLKYYSLTKLLIMYGLIGTIFSIIACTILTFVECSDSFCKVNYNDSSNYYDNFYIYYEKFKDSDIDEKIIEISVKILGFISFFFIKFFSLFVIKYLSPVYIILSFPLLYFSRKVFSVSNTLLFEGTFFVKEENRLIPNTKFFLDLSADIISILGFLIYLEIIILNFWGFNYNVKQNIRKRSIVDLESSSSCEDDDDEVEDIRDSINKNKFEKQEKKLKLISLN